MAFQNLLAHHQIGWHGKRMLKSSLNPKNFSVWSMAVPLHLLTPVNKHCGTSKTSMCMPLSACQLWWMPHHCTSFTCIQCMASVEGRIWKGCSIKLSQPSQQILQHSTWPIPSKPVTIFINTIQSISHQLAAIKHPLHDTEITDIISLCLHESFSPVRSALITRKEEPTLTEIIATVKEHEAHTAMTN